MLLTSVLPSCGGSNILKPHPCLYKKASITILVLMENVPECERVPGQCPWPSPFPMTLTVSKSRSLARYLTSSLTSSRPVSLSISPLSPALASSLTKWAESAVTQQCRCRGCRASPLYAREGHHKSDSSVPRLFPGYQSTFHQGSGETFCWQAL